MLRRGGGLHVSRSPASLPGLLGTRELGADARAVGGRPAPAFVTALRQLWMRRVNLSTTREILGPHRGAVNALQVDGSEQRYLLAGLADGSLAIYDLLAGERPGPAVGARASSSIPGGGGGAAADAAAARVEGGSAASTSGASATAHPRRRVAGPPPLGPRRVSHAPVLSIGRTSPGAHRFGVSAAAWYPTDTGAFVTGSFDESVRVWDTNSATVACQFSLPAKVYAVALPAAGASHCLIAAATGAPTVLLCDPATGAFAHTLGGHRDAVWAAAWATSSEYILATGGCEGAIRLWDIRRAGTLMILDMHNVAPAATEPVAAHIAATGGGRPVLSVRGEPGTVPGAGPAVGRAHDGSVTALAFTPDGLHLLSAGRDSRLRLWELATGRNTLVNYAHTRNVARRGCPLGVSPDGAVVVHPSGNVLQMFDVPTGAPRGVLRGHYDAANCCCFHPSEPELYSGGSDRQILVWGPERGREVDVEADRDAWSDDEDNDWG